MSFKVPIECANGYNVIDAFCADMGGVPSPQPPRKKWEQLEAVNEIRRLLSSKNKNIYVPELEDRFILRFLRARKMDVEASYQLILNYFAFRQNNPTLFKDMNAGDQLIVDCIRDGLPMILKSKDRKGRCVVSLLMYQWDRTKYPVETLYRSLVLSLEYLLSDEQNQIFGFVFVLDWTNFTLRDYVDMSPKILKLFVDGFQDSFPARIRNVHFVGQPWYINGILAVIKPFLKEKTKQRLIIHGSNLSTLHEYIPRDVVGAELGGEGIAYQPDEWIELLERHEREP